MTGQEHVDDLCVISTYFNPCQYDRKRRNLEHFLGALRSARVRYLIAEGVFDGQRFILPADDAIVRVRCGAVLWQKERLLNLLLSRVPARCTKVAWLDADVLFTNDRWAHEASRLLDELPVVQLFERAIRLPPDQMSFAGEGACHEGFAAVLARRPAAFLSGQFAEHGHTGFAWAARKEILLQHGFYDRAVAGGADHLTAHALVGDWRSPCVERMVGAAGPEADTFAGWALHLYESVRGQVGVVSGQLLHLYHGSVERRRYSERHRDLARLGFDPRRDLLLDEAGTWCWPAHRTDLLRWGRDYFEDRREDDAHLAAGGY